MDKTIISRFENIQNIVNILDRNPGIFVLKIGASWCRPCKQIKPVVDAFFASSPANVICAAIDIVDKGNEEVYNILKKRLRLQAIPCMLMYKKGNQELTPDEMITGSEPSQLHIFFKKCGTQLHKISIEETKSINA